MAFASAETPEFISSVIQQVSKIVSEMAGIQLGEKQYSMVENRLKTRMLRLGVSTFQEYLGYLKKNQESESQALLSLMTTHHTYFFREFMHFEYMLNKGLPRLIDKARSRNDKTIHIWSAACSRGQEVYSLAMFFNFHLSQMAPDLKFKIWGTDVDPESVKHAKNGVYKADELKQSPAMYVGDNWVRGKGEVRDFTKVKDKLKSFCHFTSANLLNCGDFLRDKQFDVIFCRNVFIYFNQDQIKKITSDFVKHLDSDGFLFLGVSESLNGLGLPLDLSGPSIYQHPRKAGFTSTPKVAPVESKPERPLEVLSVDDSPTILALLKKILVKEHGFTVTATANNGKEALEILKTKKFDLITLDLHMPELDGLGFLQTYQDRSTPILIVSSINRDDTTIAQKAMSLGASDYVEKPSLENLAQAGNEIRSKMKTVIQMKRASAPVEPVKSAAPAATTTPRPAVAASSRPTTTSRPATSVTSRSTSVTARSTSTFSKTATSGSKPGVTARPSTLGKTSTPSRPVVGSSKPTPSTRPLVAVKPSVEPKKDLNSKIKVLVVDDSETIRILLEKILEKDPAFQVVALAERPSQVEDLIKQHKPDVITMDINMPEMDGVQLLEKIHPIYRIPTVMISSISKEEGPQVLRALEIGAVDYIQKPQMNEMTEASQVIRDRLKIAAKANLSRTPRVKRTVRASGKTDENSLIVIGASTGGTEALRIVLESLPAQIPPILIVQHIPPVFSAAFAQRLNEICQFEVREARDGDEVKPNLVLIAPGGKQMGVKYQGDKMKVVITDDAPVNRHKPSVDYLFKSVADANVNKVVAVMLTGMGADGAKQMKVLKDAGAKTIAQDQATSVVYGMPREAVAVGAVDHVLGLDLIAEKMMSLCEFSGTTVKKKAA